MNNSTSKIASRQRVAFVQACWHREIVDQLRDAFESEFSRLSDRSIDFYEVPGAYEIPLHAKALADSGEYAAVIAAGLVVDGGIYRHDFVATTVIDGLMSVQLDTSMPVFSAVLTPHHFHDNGEHQRFFKEHFVIKGREVAHACAETLNGLSNLRHTRAA